MPDAHVPVDNPMTVAMQSTRKQDIRVRDRLLRKKGVHREPSGGEKEMGRGKGDSDRTALRTCMKPSGENGCNSPSTCNALSQITISVKVGRGQS